MTSVDRIGHARERARLLAVIDRARGGRGPASIVIRGERGIGKSALLGEFASLAADAGFRVSAVSAGTQPGDPLGAALRVVSRLDARCAEPAEGTALHRPASAGEPVPHRAAPSEEVLRELVETVCRQARRTPVAICLDDAGHLDPWSLHWLSGLYSAASDLPLAIALTGGDIAAADQDPWPPALAADAEHIALSGLEPEEVGAFAAAYRNVPLDAPTAQLCHELTGGNPALLLSLLACHTGTAPTADALRDTAASAVLPGADRWLAGLGGAALGLARAVAVLGPQAEITQCAELAGLSVREALPLIDELVARSLFANRTPLSFRHPLLAGMVI
ncbi:ATP-binding protein, partial [Streptomyces olivaceoviridis]